MSQQILSNLEMGETIREKINGNFDELYTGQVALSDGGAIKGIKTKTQAEYDALPASKLTDGIIYFII